MKTIVVTICAIAGAIAFSDQSSADSADSAVHTLEYAHRHRAADTRQAAVPLKREVSGAIPRAIRGGDPFELLNPLAPAKYGTAEEDTVLDPQEPGRGQGVKLLSFSF